MPINRKGNVHAPCISLKEKYDAGTEPTKSSGLKDHLNSLENTSSNSSDPCSLEKVLKTLAELKGKGITKEYFDEEGKFCYDLLNVNHN